MATPSRRVGPLALLLITAALGSGCLDTSPDGKTFLCDPASGADCKGAGSASGSTTASGSVGTGSSGSSTTATSTTASTTATSATASTTSTGTSSTASTSTGTSTGTGSTTGTTGTTGSTGSTGYALLEIVGTVSTSSPVVDVDVLDDGTILALAANQIFTFDANGTASVYAGTPGGGDVDGPRLQAGFYVPNGVTHAGNVIYVSEYQSNLIRRIDASGNVGSFAGSGSAGTADGAGPLAEFNSPGGMAVDAAGDVLVADTYSHRLRRIIPSATGAPAVRTLAGTTQGYAEGSALGAAQFAYPRAITPGPNGLVFTADSENRRIRAVASGTVSTLGQLTGRPFGVVADAAGNVYASDIDASAIYRFDPAGNRSLVVAGGAISSPRGIKLDRQGRLIVGCAGNNNIVRITLN